MKNILVAIDGSDYSKVAIEYGLYLSKILHTQLIGLHVIDIHLLEPPMISDISGTMSLPILSELTPEVEKDLEEKADKLLRAFREQCEREGVTCETKKYTGLVEELIIEEAKSVDLVIMGRRGEHYRLGEVSVLGSITESVLQRAGVPVMVSPEGFTPIRAMAVAFDASPPATKAINFAARLSETTGWPIQVLFVTEDRESEKPIIDAIAKSLAPFEVNYSLVIRQGKEEKAIVHFAQSGAVQLLVMGAFGQNKLRRLLLGSTTAYVTKKSPIPVLLLR